jgi:hypothetical protein
LQQQPAQTEIMSLKSRLRDEMCLANGRTQRLELGRVIDSLIFFVETRCNIKTLMKSQFLGKI